MASCSACGFEYEGDFKFCPECGTSFRQAPAIASEERKVVTVLFCDLVGFTATSESADPEDVRRMLAEYFNMARTQIERHGGIVEKFIGDAVFGIFGVPAAHEDDPHRAVSAALRIVEQARDLSGLGGEPVQLRVGINTGEAFVQLGVDPASGQGVVTGDAVNTAARIQSAAPPMAVAVGTTTYEATAGAIDYEELASATLKGKSEPVRVFRAKAPRTRRGLELTHHGPFIGRTEVLARLNSLFDRTVAASSIHLVIVAGEPGIGKSRIVSELLAHAEAGAFNLTWRQGRCLPYGDGVTFWALGEIVKAHAGIAETDDPEAARAKLIRMIPSGPDRDWMGRRLLPLVGVDVSSPTERDELFAAWRAFITSVAETAPTVLVFEDVHWADDAMLAFLATLPEHARDVPLLVVCTARPELFERNPGFGGVHPNVTRVNVEPLNNDETARLVGVLLDGVIPTELQGAILERSAGNPLYVEEYVRLLRDKNLLTSDGGALKLRSRAELPVPGSVQALIAARLDMLPAEQKALLGDAAVVGRVFWTGAVAAIGGHDAGTVDEAMADLCRKQIVRASRQSSMTGETEYSFWHVLARDVAYAQLPRAARSAKHGAAGAWLEVRAGARVEDVSEVIAHHYGTALELARAAADELAAAKLRAPALHFLFLAGEHVANLDTRAALATYRRAFEASEIGDPERIEIWLRMGESLRVDGQMREAAELLEVAMTECAGRADEIGLARVERLLSLVTNDMGDGPRSVQLIASAVERLERFGPSEQLCLALRQAAWLEDHDFARRASLEERAISMATELDRRDLEILGITQRGLRRVNEADRRGMEDIRAGMTWALDSGAARSAGSYYTWLTWWLDWEHGHASALSIADEGIAYSRRRGMSFWETAIRETRLLPMLHAGDWARLVEDADSLIASKATSGADDIETQMLRLEVLSLTGHVTEAGELAVKYLDGAKIYDWFTGFWLGSAVRALRLARNEAAACSRMADWLPWLESTEPDRWLFPFHAIELVREAIALGDIELARRYAAVRRIDWSVYAPAEDASVRAAMTEADGDLPTALAIWRHAAELWSALAVPFELSMAQLGAGRCCIALGDRAAAGEEVSRARAGFVGIGATPALEEAGRLEV